MLLCSNCPLGKNQLCQPGIKLQFNLCIHEVKNLCANLVSLFYVPLRRDVLFTNLLLGRLG